VEDRDQHAQQQSCDFHDHASLDSIEGKKPLQSVEQPNHAAGDMSRAALYAC